MIDQTATLIALLARKRGLPDNVLPALLEAFEDLQKALPFVARTDLITMLLRRVGDLSAGAGQDMHHEN